MAVSMTLSPDLIQKEVNALRLQLADVLDFSDISRRLQTDLKNLQDVVHSGVGTLGKELESMQSKIQTQMSEYFKLEKDLILFKNTDKVAAGISSLIANLRAAANKAAKLAQQLAQEIEKIAKKFAQEIERVAAKFAREAKEVVKKCDLTLLVMAWGKKLPSDLSPMVTALSHEVSVRMSKGMAQAIDSIARQIVKEAKGVCEIIAKEAKKYAKEAEKFAKDVKKKTPGPRTVKLAITLVLRNNAFNWRSRRFEYQGRGGIITSSIVNKRVLNKVIVGAEHKVTHMASTYIAKTIAGQLEKKGLGKSQADQVAVHIVSALESKF